MDVVYSKHPARVSPLVSVDPYRIAPHHISWAASEHPAQEVPTRATSAQANTTIPLSLVCCLHALMGRSRRVFRVSEMLPFLFVALPPPQAAKTTMPATLPSNSHTFYNLWFIFLHRNYFPTLIYAKYSLPCPASL
jgi:hypothetical protein